MLCLLATAALGTLAHVTPWLPAKLQVGSLVLWASVVALAQSLIRDVIILARARVDARASEGASSSEPSSPPRGVMCLESSLGLTGVLIGGGLLIANLVSPLGLATRPSPLAWTLGTGALLLGGVWVKDFVFTWRPWRFYKDPDHVNLVVGFRRGD